MALSRKDVYNAAQILRQHLDDIDCPFAFMGGLGLLLHDIVVDRDIENIQVAFDESMMFIDVFTQLHGVDDRLVLSDPPDAGTWIFSIRPYEDEIIVDVHATQTGHKGIEGGIGAIGLSLWREATPIVDGGEQFTLEGYVLDIEALGRQMLWSYDQQDVTYPKAYMDLHLLMRDVGHKEEIKKIRNDHNLVPRYNFVREVFDSGDRIWEYFAELFKVDPESEAPSDESSGQEGVFSENEEHWSPPLSESPPPPQPQ